MPNMIILTINSTHFFLVDCQGGKLLVDAGWSMAQFTAQMKIYRIGFNEIRWVMFTHTHTDHAGLIQEIKERSGARLIIHEGQISYLDELHSFLVRKGGGKPIRAEKGDLISPSPEVLRAAGIPGEIVETPGHSPDSISLLLAGGAALIGDLHPPAYEVGENYAVTCASWKRLVERGARVFYPSHTDSFTLEQVEWQCEEG